MNPVSRSSFRIHTPLLALAALALGACATPTASPATAPAAAPTTPVIAAAPAPANPAPVVASPAATPTAIAVNVAAAPIDFEKQVQPFFAQHCFMCHGGPPQRRNSGGVNLTNASGVSIAANDNLVYELLISKGSDHMPPRNRPQPSETEIAMIKQWLKEGAKYPATYSVEN